MRLTPGMCLMMLALSSLARDGEGADASAFKISGSVRVREEVLSGQFRPGFDEYDDLFSIRSILLAEWKQGNWRLGAELYDSRAYDTDPGSVLTTGEVNTFEPVQVYAVRSFPDAFGKGTTASIQAGRFTMNLGSRRLVAADDYRNTTNGYTGVRADMTLANKSAITLYYTLPQERLPDDLDSLRDNEVHLDHESLDVQLWGALASKPGLFGSLTGDVGYVRFVEADGDRPTRDRDLHSFSARLIRDAAPGTTDFEIEGIYQFGDVSASLAGNAATQDVAAYFVHADIGHTFGSAAWRPRLSVEYDYAGGNGPATDFGRFDTLYGMRRADLGPAGIYAALGRTNLQTIGLRLETIASPRLDGFVTYRALWAVAATDSFSTTGVRDPTGAAGRFAGYQLDTRVRYWIIPQSLRAEFNGVWLDKQGLLREAPNAPPYGDTLYGSFALTLSF